MFFTTEAYSTECCQPEDLGIRSIIERVRCLEESSQTEGACALSSQLISTTTQNFHKTHSWHGVAARQPEQIHGSSNFSAKMLPVDVKAAADLGTPCVWWKIWVYVADFLSSKTA